MPKDTNVVETTNANKVFDIPVKLEPGQINTLSFSQDSIAEMRQLAKGELEIIFRDGSKVVVENFDELVNSAQSCGRDTIIQLSDNTIIYPEELAAKLNAGPVNFALATDASGAVLLSAPKPGQIAEKNIESGLEYKLDFSFNDTASAAQAGNNLIVTFKDGGVLILNNYFTAMNSELPPPMTLADGSVIDSNALLTSCKLVEVPAIAEAMAGQAVPDVEPAAGEEVAQAMTQRAGPPKQAPANIEPAAGGDLANIEPAAGDAGGNAPSSSGRGYGFGSSIDGAALNGANPVGPIGATALGYNAEFPDPRQTRGFNGPAGPIDTNPELSGATNAVDETNLATPNVVTGNVGVNYGANGAGSLGLNTNFSAGGSLAGGALTSQGHPVTVTLSGNTYTGVANGVTVFTLTLDPATGNYVFTQNAALDHADGANPNDLITLTFGITATDSDGDTVTNTILIGVYDDAPIASDDVNSVGSDPLTVTGNVTDNDYLGNDAGTLVTQVTFNGAAYAVPAVGTVSIVAAYGTLTIGSNGAYTYVSHNTADGIDVFTYTIVDFDGDPSSATLTITVTDIDTVPSVTPSVCPVDETDMSPTTWVGGSVGADFKDDGPGTFSFTNFSSGGSQMGGALSSGGVPVTVALEGGVFVGKAGGVTVFTITLNPDTGAYIYTQLATLDHADGTDPNDVISLTFGVNATDADGDSTPTTITINVYDDGPVAKDDVGVVEEGTLTATGNVLDNDNAGNDGHGRVTEVTFNGTTIAVPAVGTVSIAGIYGTLTIGANGAYTYTSFNTATGSDVFTYGIKDFDGDKAVAKLTLTVEDIDTCPTITIHPAVKAIDETYLGSGPQEVHGTIVVNYGADGPGTVAPTGVSSFSFSGSTNDKLTSGGVAIVVTLVGNQYIGKAGAETIFTLTLNNDGTYSYVQTGTLDHADAKNPDDVITLSFGVTATDSDGDSATAYININVHDDAPVAHNDVNTVESAPGIVSGNVTDNDNPGQDTPGYLVNQVVFNGFVFNVPATGSVTVNGLHGTLTIDKTGAYTYQATSAGSDVFYYQIVDFDGDRSTATLTITVNDIDTCPTVENVVHKVDETALDNSGPQTVTGTVVVDYGADGPGTVAPTGTGSFAFGGSVAGGTLKSNGSPVTVTLTGDTYTGKSADGRTIFTLQVKADGTYTFKLLDQLDHADKNDPDDVISLKFGFTAKDTDGDAATGNITINVHDDGPVAVDDVNSVASAPGSATGNVLANDDAGADEPGVVKTVTFGSTTVEVPATGTVTINGAHGTLTIAANGNYTYQATSVGVDQFTYGIVDFDGDKASAKLTITVNDIDTCPTVENVIRVVDETDLNNSGTQTLNGTVVVDYGADGPGTVHPSGAGSFTATGSVAGGSLKSNGFPVTVTLSGDTYTGKSSDGRTIFTLQVKTDGTYTFKLLDQLDHADKTNPDDIINLNFGFVAKDTDDDSATGRITIQVKDDGPVAVDDVNTVDSAPGSVSANVLTNDKSGADGPAVVKQVTFGATTVDVPATGTVTIAGAHGTLTIAANGAYTYNATSNGVDVFVYKIVDFDGDPATAKLTLTVTDIDTTPCIENAVHYIDETALAGGTQTINGTLVVDYLADGPGQVTPAGSGTFTAGGSLAGGMLTSNGSAVTVTLSGDTYTGKSADGRTIFTLQVKTDGTYTFKLIDQLDHADKTNPNDIIALNFGVLATDTDGDSMAAKITINVKDDAPIAVDDVNSVSDVPATVTGNILANDNFGVDAPGALTKIGFNGTFVTIPATGTVTIAGAHGSLTIKADGTYSYTGTSAGVDQFVYTIVDYDGDPATAKLTITVNDLNTCPTVQNAVNVVDETIMNDNGNVQTVTGNLVVDYKADGPGSTSATTASSFSAGGSLTAGKLTSLGFAVTVTLVGDTYTGKSADGRTIFTLQVKDDATYTFKLLDQLDHADKTNPDDVISLNFGFKATDADGDSATGKITINVKDDGPVAVDDTATLAEAPGSVSGNVLTNDDAGADKPAAVKSVTFGSTTVEVPATGTVTINGAHGKLTIAANGTYTYTGTSVGVDRFVYKMVDSDGDPATAKLTITVEDCDYTPIVVNAAVTLDETNLVPGGHSVSGTTSPNFFGDGPGTVKGAGASTFLAGGSLKDGVLKSDGVLITVTLNAATNTYEGFAGSRKVFDIKINEDGTFKFTQFDNIDHGNPANTNEAITLKFGVVATDADGDTATGTITVTILDDAPIARDDFYGMVQNQVVQNGNVLTNDTIGNDYTANAVTAIKLGTQTFLVPNGGSTTVVGTYGTLVINSNGTYTYTAKNGAQGMEVFTYTITDTDLDTSTAQLKFDVKNSNPPECPVIRAEDLCVYEDSFVAIDVTATQVGGNGNEVMTLTITGFKPGWTVDTSASGGTYNAGTGTWTITLAPGQNYRGGPVIYPPHNSDVDMNNLIVKATVYDPDTGMTSPVGTDTFDVTTDAVADKPHLNVDADDTVTNVANLYITSAVADTDGSEVIKEIQIGGVPAGWSLTNGHYDAGTGKWILSLTDLPGLKLIAPSGTIGTVDLTVTSVAQEKFLSDNEYTLANNLAYHTKTLTVSFADSCGCGPNDAPVLVDGGNTVVTVENNVTVTNTTNVAIKSTNIVTITDFDAAEGDVLDLTSMIEHIDPVSEAINNFVFARTEGKNTIISVDVHGSGVASQAQDVVVLQDVSGVKVEDITIISTTNVA